MALGTWFINRLLSQLRSRREGGLWLRVRAQPRGRGATRRRRRPHPRLGIDAGLPAHATPLSQDRPAPDDLAGRLLLLVSVGIVSAQVARRSPVHSVADATPVAAV